MNNQNAFSSLNNCNQELYKIKKIIEVFGQDHNIVPFLTNYAVIKCCGTIEICFKTIISDFHDTLPHQAKKYIQNTFLMSSKNPNKSNICDSLNKFDENWKKEFISKLVAEIHANKIESSLSSLNSARNELAHGGNPTVSFNSLLIYFEDSKRIIEILDEVIV